MRRAPGGRPLPKTFWIAHTAWNEQLKQLAVAVIQDLRVSAPPEPNTHRIPSTEYRRPQIRPLPRTRRGYHGRTYRRARPTSLEPFAPAAARALALCLPFSIVSQGRPYRYASRAINNESTAIVGAPASLLVSVRPSVCLSVHPRAQSCGGGGGTSDQ